MKTPNLKAYVAVCLTVIFWASSYVAIRIGVHGFSPGALGSLRYSIAALVMLPVYLSLPNRTKINLKDSLLIFLTGGIGIGLYNIAINKGEVTLQAAVTSFIIASMPVIAAVVARFVFNERLKLVGYIGVLISFSGILIICFSQGKGHITVTIGVLYILLCVVCGCFYSTMSKILLAKFGAIELVSLCIMAGAIVQLVFLPEVIYELPNAGWSAICAAIYLGIFPAAIAYLGFSYALQYFSLIKVTSMLYLLPFITAVMGWAVLGEVPTTWAFIGGVITLTGPVLIGRYGVKR